MAHYSKHIIGFLLLDDNVTIGGTNYYFIEAIFEDPDNPGDPNYLIKVPELYREPAYQMIQNYITPVVPTSPPTIIPDLNLHHTKNKLSYEGQERYVIDSVTVEKSNSSKRVADPWEFNNFAKLVSVILAILTVIIIYLLR